MSKKRGRPPSFSRQDRQYLADLIREYGLRGVQQKSLISVCHQTLGKIAHDSEIPLKHGRRAKRAA